MIKWIVNELKYLIAGKELEKLDSYKILTMQYRQWLAEFPDVVSALDNLQVAVHGRPFLERQTHTLLSISDLRETMRARPPAFIDRDGEYSPFIRIDNKIREILRKLGDLKETSHNTKQKLLIDLISCIPIKAISDLKNVLSKEAATEKSFSSNSLKNTLVKLGLVEEKEGHTGTTYKCTQRGIESILFIDEQSRILIKMV